MRTPILLLLCMTLAALTGCIRKNHRPPPVHNRPPSANPSWTVEQEERLQNTLRKLDEVKQDNVRLAERINAAGTSAVSEAELKLLREERDRLHERRQFLIGEINALLIERGNAPLSYTSDRP